MNDFKYGHNTTCMYMIMETNPFAHVFNLNLKKISGLFMVGESTDKRNFKSYMYMYKENGTLRNHTDIETNCTLSK